MRENIKRPVTTHQNLLQPIVHYRLIATSLLFSWVNYQLSLSPSITLSTLLTGRFRPYHRPVLYLGIQHCQVTVANAPLPCYTIIINFPKSNLYCFTGSVQCSPPYLMLNPISIKICPNNASSFSFCMLFFWGRMQNNVCLKLTHKISQLQLPLTTCAKSRQL